MRALVCLLALAAPLAAQDAWSQRLANLRARQRPGAEFCLLIRPEAEAFRVTWTADETLAPLVHGGDLQEATYARGEVEALARLQGWGPEPRWVLLAPDGTLLASGDRAPEARVLVEAFQTRGWVSRAERRARFLREHPEQGDARGEALEEAVERAVAPQMRRFMRGGEGQAPDPTEAELEAEQGLWRRAFEARSEFLEIEGWVDHPRLAEAVAWLPLGRSERTEGALLEVPLRGLRQDVEAALRRRPGRMALWQTWGGLAPGDPLASAGALLASLESMPGAPPWPPAAAEPLRRWFWFREGWAEAEQQSRLALQQAWPPARGWARGELRGRQAHVAAWVPMSVMGLAYQGRAQDALDLLERARQVVGAGWARLIRETRMAVVLAPMDPGRLEAFRAVYRLPALPDPPTQPDPPPLQAILLGVPGWKGAWDRLAKHEAFDGFGPEELQWVDLPVGRQAVLRRQREWDASPRWVLLRGEDVVATGVTLPSADRVAAAAREERPPRLEALRTFAAAHPEHLEAQERLQDLLRQRMPHPRLEVALLAQARRTLKPFLPEPGEAGDKVAWKPMPELWGAPARQLLPRLEAELQRWPESLERWQAWLDWASVQPEPPDPSALLQRLAVWKTRARGGPGPLPTDIALRVARRLKAEARWAALARWCQAQWEGGLGDLARSVYGPEAEARPEGRWAEELGRALGTLVPLYLEALQRTGRTAERKRLQDQLAALPKLGGLAPAKGA